MIKIFVFAEALSNERFYLCDAHNQ